jgi:histidinol-phosphate phosphatase family protein
MAKVKAFLLAAGKGTRLRPLTDWTPKCLLTVAGRTLLDTWLDALADAGVTRAAINTHHLADRVREHLERTSGGNGRPVVEVLHEPELLGSAGTLAAHPDFADDADDVILIYADNFSSVDLGEMLAFHRTHGGPVTMLLHRAANPRACGIVSLDEVGRVVSFVEKPDQPESDLANAGVYIVSREAYREMAAAGAFDLAHEVLPRFVGRMWGWLGAEYHRDVGTPESLAAARREAPGLRVAGRVLRPVRRPAVFLDRDGTIIEDVHHLSRPGQVRLLPGAARAVRRFREAGYVPVVVTNQSVVGRGLVTPEGLEEIHGVLAGQLAEEGAYLEGVFWCPVPPAGGDRTAVEHPDRKPGPGLLLRAAADLELDLANSWMIGDMVSDVLAGRHAGCKGSVHLANGCDDPGAARAWPGRGLRAADLAEAADLILREGDETSSPLTSNSVPCLAEAF